MKRPVEHGNVFTAIILGVSSIILAVVLKREVYSILFWIPIWMGLFLYDVPFKMIWKSKVDVLWMTLIFVFSTISVYINLLLVIPYLVFFATYSLRMYFAARKLNFVGTGSGILAYAILFVLTIDIGGSREILLTISLFIYLLGSEFTVRAKVSRATALLLYDLLPSFLFILSPAFLIFSLSLIRIPVAIRAKSLRSVGITESILLPAVVVLLSLFYIMK